MRLLRLTREHRITVRCERRALQIAQRTAALRRCSDCDDGIDAETADELESVLAGFGFKGRRVDRSKLAESWESWIHVILSGEVGLDAPLDGPRPERLEAVLT